MQMNMRTSMLLLLAAGMLAGCDRKPAIKADDGHGKEQGHVHEGEASPPSNTVTNRVDVSPSVRQNLGIKFAKVEQRDVAQTLRVPGKFEYLPTARREYRAALGGRVEVLVEQYQRVEAGTPLYRIESAAWRDLHEKIAATRSRVESMTPLREAHRVHERSLADRVVLWQERLKQLDELRAAGGGSAAQSTEARAALNATQAELADVMEKDAELRAQQLQAEAELRSLESRRAMLSRGGNCQTAQPDREDADSYIACAVSPGVVEAIEVTQGGLAEEHGRIVTTVQPEQIRFRSRAMQGDLGRLRDGLTARVAPPQGGSLPLQDTMHGVLQIGTGADANERTVDLIVIPKTLSPWARAGISGHMEIVLAGGSAELAIPLSAVLRDGAMPVIFRRDAANPDKVIRMEADVGISDGRWIVIKSGVKEGDEVVVEGNFQLMLATSGNASKGGHFHPDGTFHEGED